VETASRTEPTRTRTLGWPAARRPLQRTDRRAGGRRGDVEGGAATTTTSKQTNACWRVGARPGRA